MSHDEQTARRLNQMAYTLREAGNVYGAAQLNTLAEVVRALEEGGEQAARRLAYRAIDPLNTP